MRHTIPTLQPARKGIFLTLVLLVTLVAGACPLWAAVGVAPLPKFVALDNNGNPLASGKLYTYQAGTTTPLATYTDSTGGTPNANPTILDSSGRGDVWLTLGTAYKFVLKDAADVTLWTVDNVLAVPQGDPALINDYSLNVSQSEEVLDPGEVGSEVLATTLAQELKELRFVLKEMKGTASWRTTNTTRTQTLNVSAQATENTVWTAAGTTVYNFRFRVPDGWNPSVDITLNILRRFAVATGTAKMIYSFARYRDNTIPASSGNGIIDITHVDGFSHLLQIVLLQATVSYQAGDMLIVAVTRLGDDAGDTNAGNILMDAAWISYSGVASR